MKSKLVILVVVLVCLCERANADSTATVTTTIDWAGATFSSPLSPAPLPNNSYSTFVTASGLIDYPVLDFGSERATEAFDPGWSSTTANEFYSPGNIGSASTSATRIITTATNTFGDVGTSMNAQAERSGIITTLDGNLLITVPYTFTFAVGNGPRCCSLMVGQVFLELFGPDGSFQGTGAFQSDFSSQSFSQSGTVDWNLTGLAPGTYHLDVGAASTSAFVPEPGTLGLLGLGFALIWRRRHFRPENP